MLDIKKHAADYCHRHMHSHEHGSQCMYCFAEERGQAVVTLQATAPSPEQGKGMKFDSGKGRWTLLMRGCHYALSKVVAVLTFGAAKYADDSWQQVDNGKARYRDALYRHLNAFEAGEITDPESGLPHLAHVATNALFLLELNKEQV